MAVNERTRAILNNLPTAPELRSMAAGGVLNNLGFKLLSLFVALLIWAFVQNERVVDTVARVEVEYELPESLAFARPPQRILKMSVSGSQGLIRELQSADLSLTVDLREATPGHPIVEFQVEEIRGIPEDITVVNLVPNQLQVDLENKIPRELPLKVSQIGKSPEGYRVQSIALDPPTVEVWGPVSLLEDRDEISIRGIDVSKLTESVRRKVSLNLPVGMERAARTPIYADIVVEPVTVPRVFEEVQITLRPGWVADRDTLKVTLEGPAAVLEAMRPDQVTASVVIPKDTPPQQITVQSDATRAARFDINHHGGDQVTVTNIQPASFTVRPEE